MNSKLFILGSLVTIIVVGGIGIFTFSQLPKLGETPDIPEEKELATVPAGPATKTIGQSVAGRDITVTTFGDGEKNLLFVGGTHGGYEWNSSLLAYKMIDFLKLNPNLVPNDITVNIIPNLNPDGTFLVTGKEGRFTLTDVKNPDTRMASARFNQNKVDLNRNFACKWQATSTWRGQEVSAGTAAFSEPEAVALRDFVLEHKPTAVIFWHSQANNVYASECKDGVLSETLTLMSTYAKPAGYGEVEKFDAYPITGDAEGWLASLGIPAITVELDSYQDPEWEQNLAGTMAVIKNSSVAK